MKIRGRRKKKLQVLVLLPRFLLPPLYLHAPLNSSVTSRKRFYDRVRATIATKQRHADLSPQSQTAPSHSIPSSNLSTENNTPVLQPPSSPPDSQQPFFRPGNRYFIGVQIDCKVVKVTIDFPRFSVLRLFSSIHPLSPPLICYDVADNEFQFVRSFFRIKQASTNNNFKSARADFGKI